MKSIAVAKSSMRYFTGAGIQLGQRISILSELLSTKEEPPRIWYNQSFPTTPRLLESLRACVLEAQEHLETFFDRKDHVMEVVHMHFNFMQLNWVLRFIHVSVVFFLHNFSVWRP